MDQLGSRLLFCDYDGEFEHADILTYLGFVVDQIRPDALRAVTVGEHSIFIFSFEKNELTKKVLKTVEKLKSADLTTPIICIHRGLPTPEFLNHQSAEKHADAYVANPDSPDIILDHLDDLVGTPFPPKVKLKDQAGSGSDKDEAEKIAAYEIKISALETELEELRQEAASMDKALQAQREFYKPKLKALLEGQQVQAQSESEKLKVRLSEVEAKLLDREAKIKELERLKRNSKVKMEKLVESHQKAQQSLRSFYQEKIRKMGDEGLIESVSGDTDEIPTEKTEISEVTEVQMKDS